MNAKDILGEIRHELDANIRLRWGCYLIAVIFLLWLILVMSDSKRNLLRAQVTLADELTEMRDVESSEVWRQRVAELRQSRDQLLVHVLWESSTESQALAAIQSTVRSLAAESDIENLDIRMGSAQLFDAELGIYSVRMRLRGGYAQDDALRFVALVEDFQPVVSFERLSLEVIERKIRSRSGRRQKDSGRKPENPADNRVNADLIAYYRVR